MVEEIQDIGMEVETVEINMPEPQEIKVTAEDSQEPVEVLEQPKIEAQPIVEESAQENVEETVEVANTEMETPEIKEDIDISKIDQEEPTFISFDQPENPEAFIEQNTKQITLGIENEVLDKLIDEKDDSTTNEDVTFEIFDLLFIGLISLVSGILLAFIFIYLRSMRNSKSIQYDFEEAYDDEFNSSSMPSGLSIENNANQQQLDLAITYFEMNDLDNAKKLLKDLLNSDDAEIQKASKKLLDKFN